MTHLITRIFMTQKYKDLVGIKYGRWTVLKLAHRDKNLAIHWVCECECGNIKILRCDNLKSGDSRSCGCLIKETRKRKHGLSGTPEYNSWQAMIQRCTNIKSKQYPRYGGRGIKICDRWLDINNFLLDMGKRPSKDHTLDRIDNSLGYPPENCRWADWFVQNRNRRNCK